MLGLIGISTLTAEAQLTWPTNQFLPTFPTPATNIDCIDVSSSSNPEIDLFASLEGIVNRTQPRIACVSSIDSEGKFIWLTLHNLPYTLLDGYSAILKYQTNVNGLVVTDTNQPDTLNLATTIAGVSNLLICDPALLGTLTNAPYNLAIKQDLRGLFSNKYQVYGYLYTNYWGQCNHRIMTGLYTNLHGELRDYIVATKAANVWLDPGPANPSDQATLALFLNDMTAANGVYMGWWPSEGNGLGWIAQYGIPVLASDYFRNGSLFSGIPHPINVPPIPPPPKLTNKIYVALILSDGDNIQYMQHVMKIDWDKAARGTVPIGWTVSPLAADLDPTMLNHYWSTATTNDCLISGPSGAGYAHIESWGSANLAAFAKVSDAYLQRDGLHVITMWESVPSGVATAFATNCQTLFGLTDQSGGNYTAINAGLRTVGLTVSYSSAVADILGGITNAAAGWNGNSPLFIAAQAVVWSLGPQDLVTIANSLDTNKYVIVRPDNFFLLYNQVYGAPLAVTKFPTDIASGQATLPGLVTPNASNALAWIEWGTNKAYGTRIGVTNVSGTALTAVKATVSGLAARTVYYYRVAVSNVLGMAWGADRDFTTGTRVKVWGDGSLGQTNVPSGLTNAVGIAAGMAHGLAVKNDGTVAAWGYNSFKQTNVPAGLSGVVQVAGGIQHSMALSDTGNVSVWGDGSYGQTNLPAGLSNVIEIAAGGYHSLALTANGTVSAWGFDNAGQIDVPAGLSNVVSIAAGRYHSVALSANGTVTAWGNNSYYQTNVPGGLNRIVAIAAGDYHTLALKADGLTPPTVAVDGRWVADALSGSNGTSVSNWIDTARGKAATQITAGNQPQLFTNTLGGHCVIHFTGANSQFLTVAATNSVISGAGDFSLVALVRTTTAGLVANAFYQNTGIVGAEQPNAVADWALGLNGSQLAGGLGAGASSCTADVSLYGGTVTDGKPHIAMYIRSGGVVRLYLDGNIVAVQNSLCTGSRGYYDFQIGAMTTGSGFYDGDLAELQLYQRALSPWEISAINRTLAATYGLNGFAGTPVARWSADSLNGAEGSAVTIWTDTLAGKNAKQSASANQPKLYSNVINGHKTVRFSSGSSQFLTIAATDSPISAMGSFTLVAVLKTSTAGNTSSLFYQNTGILGAEQPGVVQDWAFCINGNQLGAGLGGGSTGCGTDLGVYGGNVTDGNPHVAMLVRAGETITLYLDGAQVASQTALCPAARGDYPVLIGAMTTNSYFFTGDLAELQMFDRALTPDEINGVNQSLAVTYGIGGALGPLVVWGNNGNGQTNVPKSLTNLVSAASGGAFNLAIRNDGGVTAWGNNTSGQTALLPGLTNVSALAGGLNFAMALGNQTPWATNATVNGYINHDLVFALPGSDPDANPFSLQVLTLPATGALYQYNAGVRGAALAANGTVSDAAGRVVFAPANGTTATPYANFNFMAQDAYYASGAAQIAVNIGYPALPKFRSEAYYPAMNANAGFGLGFSGSSNATYSIWASGDLLNWARIGTASEPNPGQYLFTDSAATNLPERFYRISAP